MVEIDTVRVVDPHGHRWPYDLRDWQGFLKVIVARPYGTDRINILVDGNYYLT